MNKLQSKVAALKRLEMQQAQADIKYIDAILAFLAYHGDGMDIKYIADTASHMFAACCKTLGLDEFETDYTSTKVENSETSDEDSEEEKEGDTND